MVMVSTQNTKNAILFGILRTFCFARQNQAVDDPALCHISSGFSQFPDVRFFISRWR